MSNYSLYKKLLVHLNGRIYKINSIKLNTMRDLFSPGVCLQTLDKNTFSRILPEKVKKRHQLLHFAQVIKLFEKPNSRSATLLTFTFISVSTLHRDWNISLGNDKTASSDKRHNSEVLIIGRSGEVRMCIAHFISKRQQYNCFSRTLLLVTLPVCSDINKRSTELRI